MKTIERTAEEKLFNFLEEFNSIFSYQEVNETLITLIEFAGEYDKETAFDAIPVVRNIMNLIGFNEIYQKYKETGDK